MICVKINVKYGIIIKFIEGSKNDIIAFKTREKNCRTKVEEVRLTGSSF
jgi:hypothetical protein